MVDTLIRWCLKHAFLVVLAVGAIGGMGYYALMNMRVDAIPDIGEKQVIVFADWPGRSPQDVDNQVMYPLTTSLTGTPGVKTIRSMSGFGFAMVFVIFKDDMDYYWEWSGQFENQVRATERMSILVPVCIFIMFVMLYFGFRRKWIAPVIFIDVAVSLSAGFLLLPIWDVNLSVAVWVGFLVLLGVVDSDSVVLSTYLEDIFDNTELKSIAEIRDALVQAGLKRIRANLMTICTTVFGLLPIFWVTGRGADVMKPIALPSLGGMAVSVVTMFIVPCLFCAVEEWKWKRSQRLALKGFTI